MRSDWHEARLDSITELIVDCPHSTPEWTTSGVIVLRNQYIRNGRLDLSAPSFTTREGYEKRVKRAIPTAGDLVLTREAPMGEVCQIPENVECCLGQRMVLIRADKTKVDPNYLLYVFQSSYFKHQVSWNEGTGTTVSNIRIPNIKAFQVPVPKRSAQKAIAHILGTLDDKIDLNRRMNETLESMAQALFQSWFVDFDPVIDNALAAGNPIPEPLRARAETRRALGDQRKPLPDEIQKLFPDAFVFDDEMGWYPEKWDVADLKSRIDVLNGCAFKSEDYCETGTFVLRTKNFDSDTMVELLPDDVYLPDEFLSTNPQHICEPFDYHLVMVGASVGNRGLIQPHQLPALRNQNMWCFRPIEGQEVSRSFVKYMLDTLVVEKIGLASGSAREFFRKGDFQNHLLGFGTPAIQTAFNSFAFPYLSKRCENNAQSQNLTKLRDTLLPKLLSGELRIPDAEKLVADSL